MLNSPYFLMPVAMLGAALLGMLSNKCRAQWGLLVLPLYLAFWITVGLAVQLWIAPPTSDAVTVRDIVNAALFALFPLILLNGPPFLIGRYVPQVTAALRRRRRANGQA